MDDGLLDGRYRRVRLLGAGAMGEVWLGEDTLLHRQVAIKRIRPSIATPDPVDLDRMVREARLSARLNHPNAVAVYDLVVEDGRPNVVMEYVAGETLADRIRASGGLRPQEVATIGAAVADALAEAHSLGIVHRDVKPANVLLTPRGGIKLADFGIARITGESGGTATGFMIGTPAFVAPEVARGAPADARSDVWSLGVTLWAALQGRPPAQYSDRDDVLVVLSRVLTDPVPRPSRGGPVGDAVMRLLAADPVARPSASDAARMLRDPRPSEDDRPTGYIPPVRREPPPPPPRLGPVAAPAAPSPAAARPSSGRRRRHGVGLAIVVAAAVIVGAIVVGAVYLVRRANESDTTANGPATSHTGPSDGSSPASAPASTPTSPPASSGGTQRTAAYAAPGGLTVTGPKGWVRDTSAGVPAVRDFVEPGADRASGTYFRIGVGNPHSKASFRDEVDDAVAFLESGGSRLSGVMIIEIDYAMFLGSDSADIEYTGTNASGVARHGLERIWSSGGVTRIISISTPAEDWKTERSLFDQLTSTCKVT